MEKECNATAVQGYYLIGDIHGHVEPLRRLLQQLDYRRESGSYRHCDGSKVLLVGDIIDRGPVIRETLYLVKGMVDCESALAVMGNHEFGPPQSLLLV